MPGGGEAMVRSDRTDYRAEPTRSRADYSERQADAGF